MQTDSGRNNRAISWEREDLFLLFPYNDIIQTAEQPAWVMVRRWASVEMQTYRDHLGKRSRDYRANMDLEALDAGDDYRKLPRSFVIFICTYDYLKAGKPVYRFQSYDVKNCLPLDDEPYTTILNTACEPEKVPEEKRSFF